MCVCVICRVQLVGRFPPCALGPLLGSAVLVVVVMGGRNVSSGLRWPRACAWVVEGSWWGRLAPWWQVGGGTGSGLAEVCGTCLDYARRADL